MPLRRDALAKTIDHTLLDPTATAPAVERLCAEAREHHFASVCVFPCFVSLAAELLRGRDVKVCTVVAFPLGVEPKRAKLAAAQACVADGADELDVCMNVPALLSGEVRLVRDELASLVRAVRVRGVNSGRGAVIVKVIVEAAHLEDKYKRLACRIVEEAEADFAETSTGWGNGGATPYDVELLRGCLPEHIGVKAAGGIASAADASAMVDAGAARLGTSDAVGIMRGFRELSGGRRP